MALCYDDRPKEVLVKSHYSTDRLDNINAIFDRMKAGTIDGRDPPRPCTHGKHLGRVPLAGS